MVPVKQRVTRIAVLAIAVFKQRWTVWGQSNRGTCGISSTIGVKNQQVTDSKKNRDEQLALVY